MRTSQIDLTTFAEGDPIIARCAFSELVADDHAASFWQTSPGLLTTSVTLQVLMAHGGNCYRRSP